MRAKLFAVLSLCFIHSVARATFDCSIPVVEDPGFHNMVLFGDPTDTLYAYHLPLFAGPINGAGGHVLKHVYQGIWQISLEQGVMLAYQDRFRREATLEKPYPFFSLTPRGQRFTLPQLICGNEFETEVLAAYGHVESNPNFPAPELLQPDTTMLKKLGATVFAKRFQQSPSDELQYILFGRGQTFFLAHWLSDIENSFDQIVAVEPDENLRKLLTEQESLILKIPVQTQLKKRDVPKSYSQNTRYQLVVNSQTPLTVVLNESNYKLRVLAEVYYNANRDLWREEPK